MPGACLAVMVGRGCHWHLAGKGQGAADTLRCTRQTHTSNELAPGAHSAKALARSHL